MEDRAVPHDVAANRTLGPRRHVKSCAECGQRFGLDATFCPFDGSKLELSGYEPPVDPLIGTTIGGRYEVQRLLGEGGMGIVYEVRHRMLGRSFAMKLLHREGARDPSLTERFVHEAKATASIKHPHIVSITDFGELEDATPYFVMELLVGQTLAQFIRAEGPVPAERAYPILIQIAAALGAAHEAGVVHRDLKPENVFLVRRAGADLPDAADEVKVVDFGAAKVLGASRVTKAGIVFGTPHYMSPEQASGQPVDHRADIYALGVIMYEMLTSRVPFEAETYMGVLTQHMFVQPPPLSQLRPELADRSGGLEDIALRALAKKPEDRYQTMNGIRMDLERAAGRDPRHDVRHLSSRAPASPRTADMRRSDPGPSSFPADSEVLAAGVLSPSPRRGVILAGIGIGAGMAVIASLVWRKPSGGPLPLVAPVSVAPRASLTADLPAPMPPPATSTSAAETAPSVSSSLASAASAAPISASEPRRSAPFPRRGASAAPALPMPAPGRTSARHSTSPGELSDPWAR
jgi:serine/threonine-protein kinase